MNNKLKSLSVYEKIVLAVFFIILIVSTYLKVAPILNYNFPFTMDQARDMLDIREIVVGLHPTLIGPTTSINGVFLGPFYYYFNVIPFAISGGDPAYLVYWNILWYTLAAAAIFFVNFKRDKTFAIIASSIFMMAPALFYSARYFWSANPMPYVTTFYFLSLIYFVTRRDIKSALLAGLISGLSMQFEAAFGVLFFPFLVLYSLIRRVPIKVVLLSFKGFFVTLLPQALFELRHGFVMTKTFINEISGKSQILGEKMMFSEALTSHWESFLSYKNEMFAVPTEVTTTIILLAIAVLVIRFRKLTVLNREYFLSSVIFIVFAFIFYSWYLHPLKGWYLLGIRVPLIFIIGLGFSELFKMGKILIKLSVAGFLIYTFTATYLFQVTFIPSDYSSRSGDKSTLRNEMEAIDWVYQKANGQGFKAYNYIPSVYDYPYQYLYWWYGTNKYGYQPETITYLDGVPEYIKDNEKFLTKKRPAGEDPLVFLIYEKDENKERRAGWLGDFTEYCTVEKLDYNWETTVELRKLCQ